MSSYDPDSLSALWEFTPSHGLSGAGGRLGAAIWDSASREIWGASDPSMTVVSMSLADYDIEVVKDGRMAFQGRWRSGGVQIMSAGIEPRAVFRSPFRLLQVYLPTVLLREAAGGHGTDDVELRDPMGEPDEQLQRLMLAIAGELRCHHGAARIAIDGLGLALSSHLLRGWSASPLTPPVANETLYARDWRLRRAIEYLLANIAEDVGLAEVAAAVGLTTAHLTKLFNRAVGLPPHRWLMQQRFQRARRLLREGEHSVTQLAHACGFASSQHLAAVFQKRLGMSPGEFRRSQLL